MVAFSACSFQYFNLLKGCIVPSTKVVEEIFHRSFYKIFFVMIVFLSHECLKKSVSVVLDGYKPSVRNGGGGQLTESADAREGGVHKKRTVRTRDHILAISVRTC